MGGWEGGACRNVGWTCAGLLEAGALVVVLCMGAWWTGPGCMQLGIHCWWPDKLQQWLLAARLLVAVLCWSVLAVSRIGV